MNVVRNRISIILVAILGVATLLISNNGLANFHEDFVHKYTELNTGNWGHGFLRFPQLK